MNKTIKLKYKDIYAEVNELKQFLKDDVLIENQKNYQTVSAITSEMSGKSNEIFRGTVKLNRSKTEQLTSALIRVLEFIESSSKEMEKKDQHLSQQIKNK